MVNRRGVPMEVVTDNCGCFVAINKELKKLVSDLDEEKIKEATSLQKIDPPFAPFFGDVFKIADINDEELLSAFVGAKGW